MKKTKADQTMHQPYQILIIANDKGGSRKSTLMIYLITILTMAKMGVQAFEIDEQGRVARLFGDIVQTLMLPDADSLSRSSIGDTAILAPMFSAFVAPLDGKTIVVEVGANQAERVAFAIKANLVSSMMPEETRVAILIPTDGSDDSIALGGRGGRLLQNALSQADIVVVQARENLGISSLDKFSASARESFTEIIEPALRLRGPLLWPMMTTDVSHAFDAMGASPVELLKAPPIQVGKAAYDPTRMDWEPNETQFLWTGGKVQNEAKLYLADLILETQRLLGFPYDVE